MPLGIGTSPLSSTPLAVAIKHDRGHCRRLILRWELYSRDSLVIIQKQLNVLIHMNDGRIWKSE